MVLPAKKSLLDAVEDDEGSDMDKTTLSLHSAVVAPASERDVLSPGASEPRGAQRDGGDQVAGREPSLSQWVRVLSEFFFPEAGRKLEQTRDVCLTTSCSGTGAPSIGLEVFKYSLALPKSPSKFCYSETQKCVHTKKAFS
eukprot:6469714-Amphidinium_carterae.4